jgi:hypothetical protein
VFVIVAKRVTHVHNFLESGHVAGRLCFFWESVKTQNTGFKFLGLHDLQRFFLLKKRMFCHGTDVRDNFRSAMQKEYGGEELDTPWKTPIVSLEFHEGPPCDTAWMLPRGPCVTRLGMCVLRKTEQVVLTVQEP